MEPDKSAPQRKSATATKLEDEDAAAKLGAQIYFGRIIETNVDIALVNVSHMKSSDFRWGFLPTLAMQFL